nr:MAG TPA: hypothetical protein [Caudoviricetes sp.]
MITNYHLDLHRLRFQNLYHSTSWTNRPYTTLSKIRSNP